MLNLADELRRTPLGEELGSESVEGLAELMTHESVKAGEPLFKQGAPSDALYIVTRGGFNVFLSVDGQDDLTIAVLGPGGVVGELEAFTGTERMASVVATEDAGVLKLPTALLRDRPEKQRAALSHLVDVIAKVLAMRLAAVNKKLVAAWSLPEAGAHNEDPAAPPLRDVLDDVWRW